MFTPPCVQAVLAVRTKPVLAVRTHFQVISPTNELLLYKCSGLRIKPGSPQAAIAEAAAATTAALDAAVAAGVSPLTDPGAAALPTDPATTAEYLNLTQTAVTEVLSGQSDVGAADVPGHHHHHHHHHHRRHMLALLNTDELPSPWKVSNQGRVCAVTAVVAKAQCNL
jgi:hypothetical protein